MSDEQPPGSERPQRAVLAGLVALVGVALAVGLILAGAALVGSRMLGLSGDDDAAGESTEQETLYLPPPEKTGSDGPEVTLDTDDPEETSGSDPEESESEDAGKAITLSSGQTEVENFGRIDLTGTYPKGEGAILQVQRLDGRNWTDFPITVSVTDGTFATYIQTGVSGLNKFRMLDKSTGEASNVVNVRVQ